MAIIDIRVQLGTMPIWGTAFTEGHLTRMMERYGIERAVVSATTANSSDFVKGNAQTKSIVGKGRIFGCAVVNTQYPAESIEDMRQYLALPSFAALMILSGRPGYPVTLDECSDILNAHRRFAKPVLLETPDKSAVFAADQIARAFPGIKFVMLGMGGSAWRTAVAVADKTLNLVLEVSGNLSPDKITVGAATVGAHRMVFGSNLPFADPAASIGLVLDGEIPDADKQMIFAGTARRMFGWGGQSAPAE
ncbi:MAG TPA: amidohydrolase family protein [Armatimonadota bacterium]|nr:amidohydrolase family protein [Armatimonadota bacterium]HOM73221.1 amidohydrolase family protein [Armatimonadota bacterium]